MKGSAFMKLRGEQGEIKGSVTQPGREGSIMVFAVNHEVISPRDNFGVLAGNCQHVPLVITKEIDQSTPLLMNALVKNEKITEFELRFWQLDSSGREFQFFTIQLLDASITGIRFEMLENMLHKEREHVSFCYKKIIWTFEDGRITAEDLWQVR